jgi:hypothetical protein
MHTRLGWLANAICFAVVFACSAAGGGADSWVPVVERNTNLTVLIRTSFPGKPPGFGSGIIIAADYVLTAKHVLPDDSMRSQGNYLIDGLVGWSDPSIDFSLARKLDIQYVSARYDFAILHFKSPSPSPLIGPQNAFANTEIHQGQDLLVMGYPNGGNLICTQGLASGEAADGKYATSASVGVGNSGGPVFGASGGLLGILLEGSGRDQDGTIHLGYFLKSSVIADELQQKGMVGLSTTPPATHNPPALQHIQFAYHVDDDKTDHSSLAASERSFEHAFDAQDGFFITSANFVGQSVNHVTKGPEIQIVDAGKRAIVRYTLQSGPIFDQWRGWIVGNVITTQQRR